MHFRDSPNSLSGLWVPGNIWFHRFTITYIYIYSTPSSSTFAVCRTKNGTGKIYRMGFCHHSSSTCCLRCFGGPLLMFGAFQGAWNVVRGVSEGLKRFWGGFKGPEMMFEGFQGASFDVRGVSRSLNWGPPDAERRQSLMKKKFMNTWIFSCIHDGLKACEIFINNNPSPHHGTSWFSKEITIH